jgi:hypothetical protein
MHSPHIFVSYTAAGIFAYLLSDDVDYTSNLFTDFSNISDELVNEKKKLLIQIFYPIILK